MKLNKILLLGLVILLLSSFVSADWIEEFDDDTYITELEAIDNSVTRVNNGVSTVTGSANTDYGIMATVDTVDLTTDGLYETRFKTTSSNNPGSTHVQFSNIKGSTSSASQGYGIEINFNYGDTNVYLNAPMGTSAAIYWNGVAWTTTPTSAFTWSLNTLYRVQYEILNEEVQITIYDDSYNVLEQTDFANISAYDNGEDLYFKIGEVFNNTHYNTHEIDYMNYTEGVTPINQFELTASNDYNSTLINEFNATFINSTNTTNLQTTNGTIFYNINEIVNLTVGGGNYFNETILNYNTSTNLQANLTQTNITFNFIFNNTLTPITTPINVTDITTGISFTAINGTLTIPPNANTNLNFNFSCFLDVFIPRNITYNFTAREISNYTIELEPTLVNLTFIDKSTSNPIENATINIKYPSGDDIDVITNSNGSALFSYVNVDTVEFGDYEITFEGTQGFISPITFNVEINSTNVPYSETFELSRANINIFIFDREDGELLTGVDVDVSILGFLNQTTTNGTINIINETFITGDYTIQAKSNGFITEQQDVSITGTQNNTINIYLLNATGENTAFLFATVIDEFYRIQQGARVSLFEYNPTTLAYTKVSEKLSNSNGEATFAIELNVKTYYITATKTIEGDLFSVETLPEIIQTENEIRNLVLKLTQYGVATPSDYLNIDVSETFVNNISTIYIDFSTIDNFLTQVCVEYYRKQQLNETTLYKQCVESSAAYIATPVLINRNYNVFAKVYQNKTGSIYPIIEYSYPAINSISEIFNEDNIAKYIILFLWVAVIVLMFKTENPMILIVLGLILSWSELTWFPIIKVVAGSVMKTVILIFMFFTARKKEDLT